MTGSYKCIDEICSFSNTITFERRFMFRHYYSKGRNKTIELCKRFNLIPNPYIEPTHILCDKLTDHSRVLHDKD